MNIYATVIPETEQRKEVNGADWFWDEKGDLQVRVSPMSQKGHELLLMVHELVEALMCHYHGVSQKAVDEFDQAYDKTHTFDDDAGDDPGCPYRHEHCVATAIERMLCAELGVQWSIYEKELRESYPGPSKKENPDWRKSEKLSFIRTEGPHASYCGQWVTEGPFKGTRNPDVQCTCEKPV